LASDKKQSLSVLVVDDEAVVRQLLERNMQGEGYQVRSAPDGEIAWSLVRESQPDIIISDMKMPRMDGFELLRKVKTDYPQIGFIVMTAFGDSFTIKEAMLLGADEYISKPFKSVEVALIVERTYWNINNTSDAVGTGCCEDEL